MPVFGDQEARAPYQPEGDYVLEVIGMEQGISKGKKTGGCTSYEFEIDVFDKAGKRVGRCYETLIDHAELAWKFDTFLKSCNVALKKGQGFDFVQTQAAKAGVTWIDPIGLRGWGRLTVEEYNGKKRNRVSIWYTDKPKLARAVRADEPEQPAGEDCPF